MKVNARSSTMTEPMSPLIPALTDRIVKNYILPKILEPITTQLSSEVVNSTLQVDYSTLFCIFQYMRVNKAWSGGFQETIVWNALRLTKYDLNVLIDNPKFRLMNRQIFEKAFLENFRINCIWFSSSWRICRPYSTRLRTEPLQAMFVWELKDLRDNLERSFRYWKSRDRRRRGWRNVVNFWITPSDRDATWLSIGCKYMYTYNMVKNLWWNNSYLTIKCIICHLIMLSSRLSTLHKFFHFPHTYHKPRISNIRYMSFHAVDSYK